MSINVLNDSAPRMDNNVFAKPTEKFEKNGILKRIPVQTVSPVSRIPGIHASV